MICKVCGAENETGSKFCLSCGAKLEGSGGSMRQQEQQQEERQEVRPQEQQEEQQEVRQLGVTHPLEHTSSAGMDHAGEGSRLREDGTGSPDKHLPSGTGYKEEVQDPGTGQRSTGETGEIYGEVPLAMNPPLEEQNASESFTKIANGILSFLRTFWSFLSRAFIHPERAPFLEERKAWVNGLLVLLLFAFFAPLMSFAGNEYLPEEANFWTEVMKPFVLYLLFFAAAYGLFFFFYMIGGIRIDGLVLLARFGSLMVIPTAFLFLSIIGLLIDPWLKGNIIMIAWKLFYVTIPFMYRPLRKEQGKGMDAFYATVITLVVLVFVHFLLFDALQGTPEPIIIQSNSTL